MNNLSEIKKLIVRLGGPVAVGKACGIRHSAVCQWKTIPSEYLILLEKYSIERGSPVLREEMRPDLFIRDYSVTITP